MRALKLKTDPSWLDDVPDDEPQVDYSPPPDPATIFGMVELVGSLDWRYPEDDDYDKHETIGDGTLIAEADGNTYLLDGNVLVVIHENGDESHYAITVEDVLHMGDR